jgi:cbb3-type cytochrome oxidase subunit 3
MSKKEMIADAIGMVVLAGMFYAFTVIMFSF